MLETIHNKLDKLSSKTGLTVLFLLAHSVLLIMMTVTFPAINEKIGTEAFDLRPLGYSIEEARMILENLDQSTIDLYLFPQIFLLDILYPLFLSLFLSALIIRLSHLVKLKQSVVYSNLFILPFIAMLADYAENILISIMLKSPTTVSFGVIKSASFFTQMKGGFTTLSWLIILTLVVIWLNNKRKADQYAG